MVEGCLQKLKYYARVGVGFKQLKRNFRMIASGDFLRMGIVWEQSRIEYLNSSPYLQDMIWHTLPNPRLTIANDCPLCR